MTPLSSDSLNNTFVPLVGPVDIGTVRCSIVAAIDVIGGPDAITFTDDMPTIAEAELYIHEYSGIQSFDIGVFGTGTNPPIQTSAVNTSGASDLLFAYAVTGTASAGTSFTIRSNFNGNLTEDQIVSGAGAYSASANLITGTDWAILLAAFKGTEAETLFGESSERGNRAFQTFSNVDDRFVTNKRFGG